MIYFKGYKMNNLDNQSNICQQIMLSEGKYSIELFKEDGKFTFAILSKVEDNKCMQVIDFKVEHTSTGISDNIKFEITKDTIKHAHIGEK